MGTRLGVAYTKESSYVTFQFLTLKKQHDAVGCSAGVACLRYFAVLCV